MTEMMNGSEKRKPKEQADLHISSDKLHADEDLSITSKPQTHNPCPYPF
jgi:hypothetical protein